MSIDLTKAAGSRSVTFNDPALITCFANDHGYEHGVAQAISLHAKPRDLAIFSSSSGQSKNIINGALAAKARGVGVVTLTGFSPG